MHFSAVLLYVALIYDLHTPDRCHLLTFVAFVRINNENGEKSVLDAPSNRVPPAVPPKPGAFFTSTTHKQTYFSFCHSGIPELFAEPVFSGIDLWRVSHCCGISHNFQAVWLCFSPQLAHFLIPRKRENTWSVTQMLLNWLFNSLKMVSTVVPVHYVHCVETGSEPRPSLHTLACFGASLKKDPFVNTEQGE